MINSTILLGMIGGPEIALIIVAVLLLFGGKKIPELMRGLGKGMKEFKDATKDRINHRVNQSWVTYVTRFMIPNNKKIVIDTEKDNEGCFFQESQQSCT